MGDVMEDWIRALSESAKDSPFYCIGDLSSSNMKRRRYPGYIRFSADPNDLNNITLDGDFTIEQLEALIEHMKKYNEAK